MPSDFSRSVPHESGVFQSVLVAQQAKETSSISSGSDEDLCSASSVTSEPGPCIGEATSIPLDEDTDEGDSITLSPASTGDLNIPSEPEYCLLASTERTSADRRNCRSDRTDIQPLSVKKATPLSQHNGLLLISKLPRPSSETSGDLSQEKKILWIGGDLVISKSKASQNTVFGKKSAFPLALSDNSLTIQKIEYKCKVLQEHSKACKCDTPRLHVYLTGGHQCSEECSLTESHQHFTISSDKPLRASCPANMTGKMKAKCRGRKSNSFKFSDNLVKVKVSSDDAQASGRPPQPKKKKLSMADKNDEPESELLGESECVWLPTIMSTLSGDVEYVVLDDDALNLGAPERPASPESLKSKINNIYEDIDEKPVIQNIITAAQSAKPPRTKLPPLRRLSEVTKLPPLRRLSEVNVIPTGSQDAGQGGAATTASKAAEESNADDPNASSLAEVCTNHCPSIRDIFGDVSVKEEPVEEMKQDMTVDDFSKEMKTSGKESTSLSSNGLVQKEETGDGYEDEGGSTNGLFAKLIKEESTANEEGGNADAHNSDDSLGPLQIDEKYTPSPEDSSLSLVKDVVELNMPSVNIISPFKIKILLGSPNREAQQVQGDPPSQVGPSSTTIFGKVVEVNKMEVATAAKKIKQPITVVTESKVGSGTMTTVAKPKMDAIQSLTCIYCHTSCPNAQALADHFENHQKDGLIICYFCQKSFGDKTGMKRHMRTHTGEKPYQCKICGKRFSLPGNFKKHRDIHEDKRTEPCGVCGKTFRRKEHLKYHMRTHTGEKPFSCSECGTCFTARYSLQIHMNIHLGKKPYKCTFCSKAFSDKSTMRKHVRVHTGEKPFRCDECWRCFGESGTLAAHMATHRNDRPYGCDKCDLRFKTTGGLRQHEKVHTGEKQFACKFCGMKFLQKYNMTMHERIHTGEKPYTCSHCQRSFRSRSCLAKHVVLHGGEDERRFGCDHCNSRFYRKAHLRRHIDMHLGIKNYQCDHCKKKFCTRGTLRSHFKTFHSTGARRFPCNRCGRVFKRKVYVNTHMCANTAYKVVNRENDDNKALETKSEGGYNESTDSEEFSFEVKSEPEDTMVEDDRITGDIDDSDLDFAIMSKEVKLEWEPENSV